VFGSSIGGGNSVEGRMLGLWGSPRLSNKWYQCPGSAWWKSGSGILLVFGSSIGGGNSPEREIVGF